VEPAALTIEPDPHNAPVYEKRYATFRKLYPRIRDLMEELGDTEMSSAK
jgi:sugar (pentulose or hexulose) kinase